MPITIKEAFDVAGLRTTSSHPPLKDNVAKADASPGGAAARGRRGDPGQDQRARAVRRLSDRQPLFGTTKNPWDPARGAGGSTGGGAAAVAARLSPLELGSDIGGSVRNPAHYNGIFSLKPTEWRVPSRGHVPDLPGMTRVVRYMGVFGPLARSVDDLETALRIIAGPDGYEAEAPPVPIGPVPKLKARTSGSPCSSATRWSRCRQDTAKVVQETARLLSQGGRQGEARGARGPRLDAELGRLVGPASST